jgi:hypothetical protein
MRARAIRLRPLQLAAIATVAALGGCSGGGPATSGPLSDGLSSRSPAPLWSQCVPGGRPVAFGFDSFTNYGHTTVILDRVVLLHPHNEHLIGSYAVPGGTINGVMHWPVRNPNWPRVWKDRQSVHGFRLAPGKSFNMVLGIAAVAAGRRAISQGELIYYHDSSGSYIANSNSQDIIAANTHTCP